MAKTRLELIGQIDKALLQMGEAFELGFTDGKPKPVGAAASQFLVFKQFWEMLSFNNFSSLAELDAFYSAQKESHSHHIDLFCEDLHVDRADITTSKKNMLLHLISVYHLFARQRYILANFPDDVLPDEFIKAILTINSDYSVCNKAYEAVNLREIHLRLKIIDQILSVITLKLNTFNYIEDSIETPKLEASIDHPDVQGVSVELQKLPTIKAINDLTDALSRARKRKHKDDIDANLKEVAACAAIMRSTREFINALLLTQTKFVAEVCPVLSAQTVSIEQHLAVVNINARILRLIALLASFDTSENILALTQKTREVCQLQSPLERVTFGYVGSVWSTVGEQINASLDEMRVNLLRFIPQYKSQLISLDHVTAHKAEVEHQLSELQTLSKTLQEKILAIGQCEVDAVNALDRVEKILQIHIDNEDETLTESLANFFRHHWGKLTIGGTGGAGAGIGLALFFALEPTKLSLLIAAAAALGTGFGAGAGAAKDRFFPTVGERQPLLNSSSDNSKSAKLYPKSDGPRPSS